MAKLNIFVQPVPIVSVIYIPYACKLPSQSLIGHQPGWWFEDLSDKNISLHYWLIHCNLIPSFYWTRFLQGTGSSAWVGHRINVPRKFIYSICVSLKSQSYIFSSLSNQIIAASPSFFETWSTVYVVRIYWCIMKKEGQLFKKVDLLAFSNERNNGWCTRQPYNQPRLAPSATTAARESTSSFWKIWLRCALTVRSVMPNL